MTPLINRVARRVADLKRDFETFWRALQAHTTRLDMLDKRTAHDGAKLIDLGLRADATSTTLTTLHNDVEDLDKGLKEAAGTLAELNARRGGQVVALDSRLTSIDAALSTQIGDIRTNMDALATGTDRLQGRVTVLEQLNKQRSDEVAVLLEKCSTLQDRIDTLEEIVAKPAPQTSIRDCTVMINQRGE